MNAFRPRFISLVLCLSATLTLAQSNLPSTSNHSALPASPGDAGRSKQAGQQKAFESYGSLPMNFEANQGQTDPRVKYLSRGLGYTVFLTGDEAVFSMRKGANVKDNA